MTIRYANSGGSNTSPYDTFAKGATNPQTIIDLAVLGDENRYYGTFTLTAKLDFDVNAGSTSGYIKHIGVNSSDVVDGTRVIIDGNSAAVNCLDMVQPYHWLENFECENATSHGITISSLGDHAVLINTIAHTNGGDGIYWAASAYGIKILLCACYSNTVNGYGCKQGAQILLSSSYNNSGNGFDGATSNTYALFYGCLSHNNTLFGIEYIDASGSVINCVIDGEAVGIDISDNTVILLGNRITNCITGIDFNSKLTTAGWNHFYNNTNDVIVATRAYNIPYREALTNDLMSDGIDGTNTVDTGSDDGYNDRGNDDFNLKSGAENRRIEVDLEVGS